MPTARRAAALILTGGAIAATVDIVYAMVFWALRADVPPARILQSVAAGLLGPAARDGGAATAALGLALHYFNASVMAVVFYVAAVRWRWLVERPVAAGALYGVGIYGFMNFVVIPLSRAMPGSRAPLWVGLSLAVHVLGVGLPIAWCVRRAVRARPAHAPPL